MPADVAAQAAVFGQGLLLGAALGLVYDLMRAVRRSIPLKWLAALLDLAFWLGTAVCLFLLAILRDTGELRIFHGAAVLLGGGGYFLTLSRLLLPLFLCVMETLGRLWRFFTAPFRRAWNLLKKFLENKCSIPFFQPKPEGRDRP